MIDDANQIYKLSHGYDKLQSKYSRIHGKETSVSITGMQILLINNIVYSLFHTNYS